MQSNHRVISSIIKVHARNRLIAKLPESLNYTKPLINIDPYCILSFLKFGEQAIYYWNKPPPNLTTHKICLPQAIITKSVQMRTFMRIMRISEDTLAQQSFYCQRNYF